LAKFYIDDKKSDKEISDLKKKTEASKETKDAANSLIAKYGLNDALNHINEVSAS
jgi:hypothetical protein